MVRLWVSLMLAAMCPATAGAETVLPGTGALEMPDKLIEAHQQQEAGYFQRRIEEARRGRDGLWKADFSTPESYEKSIEPHRERCRMMLGLTRQEAGQGDAHSKLIAEGAGWRIERLMIPVAEGLSARGILVLPKTQGRHPLVIVCGDADTWPERLAGFEEKAKPVAWLGELIGRGAAVYIPQSIERLTDHPYCKTTNGKDRRMILYRLGYIVGRTMPGLDVQDVLTAIDWFAGRAEIDSQRISIVGVGQGGMTALYAAVADRRIIAAVVGDYFQARERCWAEPVDRRLPGQLLEFGDAEVAGLVAPRRLTVVHSQAETLETQVRPEIQRAERFYQGVGVETNLRLVSELDGKDLLSRCVSLLADLPAADKSRENLDKAGGSVPADRALAVRDAHFGERLKYLRGLVDGSEAIREKRWAITQRPASEFGHIRKAMLEDYGRLVGQVDDEKVPLNPRTDLALITDKYKAYRVMLDVVAGVQVYGVLLVPRDITGRMPAVICQHGLSGTPEMITGIEQKEDTPYHEFGRELAERGYVVFAPLILHHYPVERINDLVRQADAVGMMRIAMPVAKTKRVIAFLETLPFVDGGRIGYYGLSYGGYSAIWIGPLVGRLAPVIVSGHFNDWRSKITSDQTQTSYLWHPDEDFYNWDILHRFTHPELIAMTAPRPVCVEFGDKDGITTPQWTASAWKQVAAIRDHLDLADRVELADYAGVHEIHGVATFDSLDRFLRPERTVGRDYEYSMRGTRVNKLYQVLDVPVVRQELDSREESRIAGQFWMPAGAKVLRGMAVKISVVGRPGPLEIRFGKTPGGADLSVAPIGPERVIPLFEQWYELTMAPRTLEAGTLVHYELRCGGGRAPADCYLVYGPRPIGGKDFPGRFALSYRVLTDRPQDTIRTPGKAQPFEHVRDMLSPYYTDDPEQRLTGRAAKADETRIDDGWTIRFAADADGVLATAAEDLRAFLAMRAGVRNVGVSDGGEQSGDRRIDLVVSSDSRLLKEVTSEEGYRVVVEPDRITIAGRSARGVMRGVYWVEDQMRFGDGPCLPRGTTVRNCRFDRRLVCSLVPGGSKYSEISQPLIYGDGLLQRISHQGFNGVWIWMNIEELAFDSKIFPELNNPDGDLPLARVRDVTERAKKLGIDVYGYLSWNCHRPVSDSFYAKHPDTKGVAWGNSMCPSNAQVRAYYAETVRGLFRRVPGVRGLIGIFDSEGFYHCGTWDWLKAKCPRCKSRSCEDISLELLLSLREAIRSGGANKEFIVWPYGGGAPEPWTLKVIERLPNDIIFQADFSKGTITEKDGIKHLTGDYNISTIGPPEHFVEEYNTARKAGLRVMTKTEHAVSQEFITVPYIPCMQQWHQRMEKMAEYDLAGLLASWCHYGYTPSRPAEIMMWYSWTPAPPIEELLLKMARRDFGEPAAELAVGAWDHFSRGIRHYPYSDPVARTPGPIQKGPSQPLFLDPKKKVGLPWRSWQNDLKWTDPWGPEITAKHFRLLEQEYAAGIRDLEQARDLIGDTGKKAELDKELGIARIIRASVHTILNLLEWVPVRDAYAAAPPGEKREALREKLLAIARDELANARAAVPVVEADSRLGASSEGGGMQPGGLFTPSLIRYKIGLVEDVLERQLQR